MCVCVTRLKCKSDWRSSDGCKVNTHTPKHTNPKQCKLVDRGDVVCVCACVDRLIVGFVEWTISLKKKQKQNILIKL